MHLKIRAAVYAVLAAALYAVNVPFSKRLLMQVSPTMMAACRYLGAGIGLFFVRLLSGKQENEAPLTKKELPYTVGMIVLDIAAPILLMLGVARTDAANASLLNNFEIVATALIAFAVFREKISRLVGISILLVTAASILLGFEGAGSLSFNVGSLFVLGAAACWGLENNCTRMLSGKSPSQITTVKGICSGLGSLILALTVGEPLPPLTAMLPVLLLGFVAYGLSIYFYIFAQRDLGAAKTAAFYSIAPFLGVFFSMALLGETPGVQFYLGFAVMAAAAVLLIRDTLSGEAP